jgi:hypothetical protein
MEMYARVDSLIQRHDRRIQPEKKRAILNNMGRKTADIEGNAVLPTNRRDLL